MTGDTAAEPEADPPADHLLLRQARNQLASAGVPEAGRDARILLSAATRRPQADILAETGRPVAREDAERFQDYLARRIAGEPVGRILGRRAFWTLDLALSPETLEPRPDTETLVEAVLAFLDRTSLRTAPLRFADLGTGSGAILLALLAECPNAVGVGTDLSRDALATARTNAARHGLSARALFACADFAAALPRSVDVVVSNPPYVTTAELEGLAPGVRCWDPSAALHGGVDGLDAYRTILGQIADQPADRGRGTTLFVELSPQIEVPLASLAQAMGWTVAARHADLAGRNRVFRLHLPK